MKSKFGKHLTPSTAIAVVALVFAMSGGAFAAGRYLVTSTKQISPKVLKHLRGKAGPAGAQGKEGPAGPQGKEGPAGAAGKEGPAGAPGEKGADGTNGAGATAAAFSGAAHGCEEGGAVVKGASGETAICNGKAGKEGKAGPSCNQAGECNLPSGASETGVWSVGSYIKTEGSIKEFDVPISFPLHFTFEPTVKWVSTELAEKAGSVAGCPGTRQQPTAEAGNLCVYEQGGGVSYQGAIPALDNTSGAVLALALEEGAPEAIAFGTWAVKAP